MGPLRELKSAFASFGHLRIGAVACTRKAAANASRALTDCAVVEVRRSATVIQSDLLVVDSLQQFNMDAFSERAFGRSESRQRATLRDGN